VRELIAHNSGVRSLVDVMALHAGSDSIQCHGCLALMSLVRGEGEVCQSNQWHIAKAGAIEVIAQAMQTFRYADGVCFVLGVAALLYVGHVLILWSLKVVALTDTSGAIL
jgi:hypothetical protein